MHYLTVLFASVFHNHNVISKQLLQLHSYTTRYQSGRIVSYYVAHTSSAMTIVPA